MNTADHHAGDSCIAAIEAAHKDLAEQIRRVDEHLAALADLLKQRPTIESGRVGFHAERRASTDGQRSAMRRAPKLAGEVTL